jgi:hypothetical protein
MGTGQGAQSLQAEEEGEEGRNDVSKYLKK